MTGDVASASIFDRPVAATREREAMPGGGAAEGLTIIMRGTPCPVGCVMCDLHTHTAPGPVPAGAAARQIVDSIDSLADRVDALSWIKLYNAGNFFDPRSVPPADHAAIIAAVSPIDRVIVENHPSIGRRRLFEFADRLPTQLEVAVGLETVWPGGLAMMGKGIDRDGVDAFAGELMDAHIDLRIFLIVGMPGQSIAEAMRWTRLAIRHAVAIGARHISLIPARPGGRWADAAAPLPRLDASAWCELLLAGIEDAQSFAVVTVDTWDMVDAGGRNNIDAINVHQRASGA